MPQGAGRQLLAVPRTTTVSFIVETQPDVGVETFLILISQPSRDSLPPKKTTYPNGSTDGQIRDFNNLKS